MNSISNKKGQGAIEAVITLPLLIFVVSAFILLIYRGIIFYFADYQLHEALLCTESSPVQQCENELTKRLQPLLLGNTHSKITLVKGFRVTSGEILIDLKPPMQLEKKLKGTSL